MLRPQPRSRNRSGRSRSCRAVAEEQRFVGELTSEEESERSEMLDTAAMLTDRANATQERLRNLGC